MDRVAQCDPQPTPRPTKEHSGKMFAKAFFGSLVFGQVSNVVLSSKASAGNQSDSNEWLDDNGFYSYYYGHAVIRGKDRRRERVFFQLNKHISKPILVGPVEWCQDPPSHESAVVCAGDIIFGKIARDASKRLRFVWWSSNGNCFLNLYNLLFYKSRRRVPAPEIQRMLLFKQKTKMFRCTRCKHPAPHTTSAKYFGCGCEICGEIEWEFVDDLPALTDCQDLWIIFMLLVHNNMDELLAIQTGSRGDQRVSAFTKKTLTMSYTPQRFVFILAYFCGLPEIYKLFLKRCKDRFGRKKSDHRSTFRVLGRDGLSLCKLEALIRCNSYTS